MKNKIKHFFTSTNILLLLIGFILFFGLFKKEVALFSVNNLPRISDRQMFIQVACTKEVETKEWIDYQSKNECKLRNYDVHAYLNCTDEYNMLFKGTKVKNINSLCDQSVIEKWFWMSGRYWFKIN